MSVNADGVYKSAKLGKAAGRKDDGTYKIRPVPKIHIDAGDAYFLAKGHTVLYLGQGCWYFTTNL
mgnify:CR=1 FL=1